MKKPIPERFFSGSEAAEGETFTGVADVGDGEGDTSIFIIGCERGAGAG